MSGFWQVCKQGHWGTGVLHSRWLSFAGSKSRVRVTWRKYAGAHIADEGRARDLAVKHGGEAVHVADSRPVTGKEP